MNRWKEETREVREGKISQGEVDAVGGKRRNAVEKVNIRSARFKGEMTSRFTAES